MKYWFVTLLAGCLQIAQSQPFTAGYLSGIDFTDFHGNNNSGRWQSSAGSLNGIFFHYAITSFFSVGTELNYTTQEYYHKSYSYNSNYPYPWMSSYSDLDPYIRDIQIKERWDYGFLRVPIYLTVNTPTRLQFSVSAGVFVSFITSHDYIRHDLPPNYPLYSGIYSTYGDSYTPKHDNGLWYAASLSYPVNDVLRIYVSGRYAIGHKAFVASGTGRTGVSELAFGLAYTGLFKSEHDRSRHLAVPDSSFHRIYISPISGAGVTWIGKSTNPGSYRTKSGGLIGVWIEYCLNNSVSVVSGLNFERKGYYLKDSSSLFFRYALAEDELYKADTRVDLDYIILPLMVKIKTGSLIKVYLEGGLYAGFNLNARVTGSAELESYWTYGYSLKRINVYDDIEDKVKDFELGWICGAGIEIPVMHGSYLDLGINYAVSPKNLLENEVLEFGSVLESDKTLCNRSLTVQLGLTLPISK
jgi:hypothetical protein